MTDRDDRPLRVTTLRTLSDCPDRLTCPSLHRLEGRPGIYQIGKKVTDPAARAALAPLMAADEEITWVPDELYPEVST
jgi:hypothetical protein